MYLVSLRMADVSPPLSGDERGETSAIRRLVFSTKVLIEGAIFTSHRRRNRHFTLSFEPREGLAICRAKGVPSFLSYLKTLSVGPAPGIEPMTSRSTVKRSTP